MSDFAEEIDLQDVVPTLGITYISVDEDDNLLQMSQSVRLDQEDSWDANVPKIMRSLRGALIHAGFSPEMVDHFISEDRINAVEPELTVDEIFMDGEADEQEDEPDDGMSPIVRVMTKGQLKEMTRLQVERLDLNNFNVFYQRGDHSVVMDRDFFDGILESQIDIKMAQEDDNAGD